LVERINETDEPVGNQAHLHNDLNQHKNEVEQAALYDISRANTETVANYF